MSLITSFEHRADRAASYKTTHTCGWFYANHPKQGRILQLETYTKDGSTGQVFQFDRRSATELLAIIAEVFPADD